VIDEPILKKARFYALKVINVRPRSSQELADKLKQKEYSEEIVENVISEFAKKGLLNDKKFSRLWAESRMESNPKGDMLLRQELKSKGVKDKDIDSALKQVRGDRSEYDIVKELAEKRTEALRDLDKATTKRRLFGYLKRRGFSFDVIMRVVEEIVE